MLLLRHRDVELLVIDNDVLSRVGCYEEARFVPRRGVGLNHALVDVFLHVDRQLLSLGVACLKLVVLDRLFALHVTLRRFVTKFELRNPYLFRARHVGRLLGESVDGILDVVVHCRELQPGGHLRGILERQKDDQLGSVVDCGDDVNLSELGRPAFEDVLVPYPQELVVSWPVPDAARIQSPKPGIQRCFGHQKCFERIGELNLKVFIRRQPSDCLDFGQLLGLLEFKCCSF